MQRFAAVIATAVMVVGLVITPPATPDYPPVLCDIVPFLCPK